MTEEDKFNEWLKTAPIGFRNSVEMRMAAWNGWLARVEHAPHPEATLPKGWKLVPVQATMAMHNAATFGGFYKDPRIERDPDTGALSIKAYCPDWTAVWSVMVNASPLPQPGKS